MQGVTHGTTGWRSVAALVDRLGRDDSGATAIEYGLIAGSLSIAILAGVNLVGVSLLDIFNDIAGTAF